MRPKNYLFTLSLLVFMGCTQANEDHSACDAKADSLSSVHSEVVDSLIGVIQAREREISELKIEFSSLSDSIQNAPKKDKRVMEIPEPKPEGLPTKVPLKRKEK